MSVSTLRGVMTRIKSAEVGSKIAVFLLEEESEFGERLFDAVFDNVPLTQLMIIRNRERYLGSFHRNMNLDLVCDHLRAGHEAYTREHGYGN